MENDVLYANMRGFLEMEKYERWYISRQLNRSINLYKLHFVYWYTSEKYREIFK